jgi:hypothetical protein
MKGIKNVALRYVQLLRLSYQRNKRSASIASLQVYTQPCKRFCLRTRFVASCHAVFVIDKRHHDSLMQLKT